MLVPSTTTTTAVPINYWAKLPKLVYVQYKVAQTFLKATV